jgi:hypothetical protein
MTLEHPPTSGQRQKLIRLLRDTYHDDWQRLLVDFEPRLASDWQDLEQGGTLLIRAGGEGIQVMRSFLSLLADRYYRLMRDLIHQYDATALYLGDRYQSFYYPEVARAAAPYVDVVSTNLNATWCDGTFARCYLDTLHALTGKPILVSEFYAAAFENRSGNKNNHGTFPAVATQAERSATALRTLVSLGRLPFVVGADWFQFADEPEHGRPDGENYNFGLVDIHNRPYDELVGRLSTIDLDPTERHPVPRPDATAGIPRAPLDPFQDFRLTRALLNWDRERGFVPPGSPLPLADLYCGWSDQAIYLGLCAFDIVEPAYYSGSSIPKQDRALWTVRLAGGNAVQARLGAGREPLINDRRVRVENLSGVELNVRNIAALRIPAELFGKKILAAGDEIELESSLDTHFRASRVEWRGKFRLID